MRIATHILMGMYIGLIGNVSAFAQKPNIKVIKDFKCSGKIAAYSTGIADRSVGEGDSMCYFNSQSTEGRKILGACPLGTNCEVTATVKNDQDAGDWSPTITDVSKVARTR